MREAEGERQTGQEKWTDKKPPGLDVEREPKTQEEKEPSQVESEQKAQRRAQEVLEEEVKA